MSNLILGNLCFVGEPMCPRITHGQALCSDMSPRKAVFLLYINTFKHKHKNKPCSFFLRLCYAHVVVRTQVE